MRATAFATTALQRELLFIIVWVFTLICLLKFKFTTKLFVFPCAVISFRKTYLHLFSFLQLVKSSEVSLLALIRQPTKKKSFECKLLTSARGLLEREKWQSCNCPEDNLTYCSLSWKLVHWHWCPSCISCILHIIWTQRWCLEESILAVLLFDYLTYNLVHACIWLERM